MKVFVSSVISDYEEYRGAARNAIQVLGEVPVMAEHDFGAKPMSPRDACLEGVRKSDVYIGLFGKRYGYQTDRGKSVTEEEFEEARCRSLHILVFEERIEKEKEQLEFLSKVKGFEEGYFIDNYYSVDELKDKIIRALANLRAGAVASQRSSAEAVTLLQQLVKSQRAGALQEPWVLLGVIPSLAEFELVSSTDLGRNEVREKILRAALFGDSAVLSPELGYSEVIDEDVVRFIQPAQQSVRQVEGFLELYIDGSIQVGRSISMGEALSLSAFRNFLIDEEEVEALLLSTLHFIRVIFGIFGTGGRVPSIFLQARLGGLNYKMLGKIPKPEPTSVSVPMHSLPDPLIVPRNPHEISRAALSEANRTAGGLLDLIRRQFVLGGAYYESH